MPDQRTCVRSQYATKNKKIMERCSKPRRGLEAPDPIELIFKEKMGVQGLRSRAVQDNQKGLTTTIAAMINNRMVGTSLAMR